MHGVAILRGIERCAVEIQPGTEVIDVQYVPVQRQVEASQLVADFEREGVALSPVDARTVDVVITARVFREGIELVRYAEQQGFDAVWQADSRLVRDAVVPMAAFAASTDRIKVGSGVIDIWTRNPARLASTFSTLDDLAPGRIICGLGAWWDPLASKVGIHRERGLVTLPPGDGPTNQGGIAGEGAQHAEGTPRAFAGGDVVHRDAAQTALDHREGKYLFRSI